LPKPTSTCAVMVVSEGLGAASRGAEGGGATTTAGTGLIAAGRAGERDDALRAGAGDFVAGAGDGLRVAVFFLDALMTMGGY